MDLRAFRRNLSGLFKTKEAGADYIALSLAPAETPELYLKLTTKCMNQVDSMLSLRVSSPLKFNHEQCRYLVGKLQMAVQSAHSFFEHINTWYSTIASDEDMARSLEIFKLLFALAKEVESFIQGCCKKTWIQSAIFLANVSSHISSLGFNLEVCTIVFSARDNFATRRTLTVAQVASLGRAEAKIVKEKADIDDMRLVKDVSALIQCSKSNSEEWQMATFLLKRMVIQHPRPACPASKQFCDSETLFKNLEELEILGKGAFGTVHKARWLGSELVAKKAFHGHGMSDFLQEVSILDGLRHPNIVSLLWYMTDLRKCYMIMELMDGDLYSLMEKRMEENCFSGFPFTTSEALDIMLQVGEGMLFLHEKRIVHRDLKSHNILVNCVKAREANLRYLHAKVADFGLSKTKETSMTYSDQTQNQGTTRWMAPEMIKIGNDAGVQVPLGEELKYPFKSDIYSFGMVCYEILTGYVPFHTLSPKEVRKRVLGGDRPQLPEDECPKRLRALIEACWNPDASARPDFGHICAELWHLKCEQLMISAWAKVPRTFSYPEIMIMTNGFSRLNHLLSNWSYSGNSADVYKGVMVDTGEVVAVQRICHAGNNFDWFRRLYQNNMAPGFIGFFYHNGINEQILVFEHMPKYKKFNERLSDDHKTDSNDPVLGRVRELVFLVHVGSPKEKADGAECLGILAKGSERNVKIIIKEGGAPPLLRLLREGTVPSQEAAATALGHLARDKEGVRQLRDEGASSVFTQILGRTRYSFSSKQVQAQVARLVAKFATLDEEAQEELANQDAIRMLVAHLAYETNTVESLEGLEADTSSMFAWSNLTQVRNSTGVRGNTHTLNPYSGQSCSDARDQPVQMSHLEVKLALVVEVVHALWKLAAGNVNNSKLITKTCALRCFVKLMKHSGGELKYNSVMAVMEIAAAAKSNTELRQAAFKTNSPAANAVMEQLLEEITSENGESELQVSCCKAIGSLAHVFSRTAKRPISALTSLLLNQNQVMIEVATEAASALSHFASNENRLHLKHSKDIIAEGAVEPLVLLIMNSGYPKAQLSALQLLCYLSFNVPDSQALAKANIMHVLKSSYLDNRLSLVFSEDEPMTWRPSTPLADLINIAIATLEDHQLHSSSIRIDIDPHARGAELENADGASLLRMLKHGSIPDQEAAATLLGHLARDKEEVRQLLVAGASRVFTHILESNSASLKIQAQVARLVAKFSSLDEEAQSELAYQGVIRLLVAHLAYETKPVEGMEGPTASSSLRMARMRISSAPPAISENPNSRELVPLRQGNRVLRDLEDPEVKYGLKVEAAYALWKLAAGNIKNSKLIADKYVLLCFAKLMKHSGGKLKYNTVMAVMEIAAAAESDFELRRRFKTNSPSGKAVVEQLLEEISSESGEPELQVSCCKAIGSLARIFCAQADLPIRSLISALANQDQDVIQVATAAASALSKFASDENYLHLEHSESIIAEGAVEHLVLLALNSEYPQTRLSAVELLAYLALNVPDSEALARAFIIHVLRSSIHDKQLSQMLAKHETVRPLINDAIAKLEIYKISVCRSSVSIDLCPSVRTTEENIADGVSLLRLSRECTIPGEEGKKNV